MGKAKKTRRVHDYNPKPPISLRQIARLMLDICERTGSDNPNCRIHLTNDARYVELERVHPQLCIRDVVLDKTGYPIATEPLIVLTIDMDETKDY